MSEKNKKSGLVLVIVLAVVFGMSAGVVGDLIARVYLLDNNYNIPFYGEVNFSNGNYSGNNIIIRDAKKVVVEQDNKVEETINSVSDSLVGIYKKNTPVDLNKIKSLDFDLDSFYDVNQKLAQGLIITSDGWIISSFKPDSLNYVIITQDKKIYTIDKIVSDTLTPYYFLHVEANDFPVVRFTEVNDISNGQLVIVINKDGDALLNSITDKKDTNNSFLFNSDIFNDVVSLSDNLDSKFINSTLFDLSGAVIGLSDKNGRVRPINHFTGAIKSLLKYKIVARPSLGINYLDLSKLIIANPKNNNLDKYERGALIQKDINGVSVLKGSVADEAGLITGDIILSVEGVEINESTNLTDIVQNFIAEEIISIDYLRDNDKLEIEIELGELK